MLIMIHMPARWERPRPEVIHQFFNPKFSSKFSIRNAVPKSLTLPKIMKKTRAPMPRRPASMIFIIVAPGLWLVAPGLWLVACGFPFPFFLFPFLFFPFGLWLVACGCGGLWLVFFLFHFFVLPESSGSSVALDSKIYPSLELF